MKKVLYITPHLSTGGLPQYLLKKIQLLIDTYEIYVIEYNMLSQDFVVQRKQIENLLSFSHFLPLYNNKELCLKYIEIIEPDIIHFEEIPELFMDNKIVEKIYNKEQRDYVIFETSHTVEFDPNRKLFYPDKFIFVSEYQVQQYNNINISKEIVEYPMEYKNEKRDYPFGDMLKSCKHILVVGLFTPNKNQKYAFEIAKHLDQFLEDKIVFDFIGNYAPNFEYYWKPLFNERPINCFVHGEKNNIDDYYANCDAVLFPSNVAECAPLVIRETMSWNKPLFLFNLKYYKDKYKDVNNVYYLTGDARFDALDIRKVVVGS